MSIHFDWHAAVALWVLGTFIVGICVGHFDPDDLPIQTVMLLSMLAISTLAGVIICFLMGVSFS